ncbi:MAG: LysR substrate-binding domain-containing protein [Cocleimonas sp.]|nr:LysR substrate-binding domain-containing protein [Cocleimonas sp.]
MKITQLQLLKTLLNNGLNITKAAKQHFIVQSAVSRQLNLLEEELGMPLFERKGKRLISPTPLCLDIAKEADMMELALENIRAIADDYRDGRIGELRLATTHTQAKYFLPSIINEFREKYPKVKIQFLQGNPSQLVEMLHRRDADIAICTEELGRHTELVVHKCYDWNHVLVVPPEHPLATEKLDLTRIANYPLLTYVFGFTGRTKIHEAFNKLGLDPDISFAAMDSDVIKSYVRLGYGAGIIARMSYSEKLDNDLVLRDLSDFFPDSTTRAAYIKSKYMKDYLKDCIELMVNHGGKNRIQTKVSKKISP